MVNWTADKDQIILRGIFKFHDIKSSSRLLDYLAKEIGDGCTPKAVSHRLGNLRKTGQPLNSGKAPKKTIPAPKATRAPSSGHGRGLPRPKKAVDSDATSDDSNEEEPVAAHSTYRKRARTSKTPKSCTESDATSGDEEDGETFTPAKKVKAEPVEDGDSSATSVTAPLEEDDEGVAFV